MGDKFDYKINLSKSIELEEKIIIKENKRTKICDFS